MEVIGQVFQWGQKGELHQVEYLQSREKVARIQATKSKQRKDEAAGS